MKRHLAIAAALLGFVALPAAAQDASPATTVAIGPTTTVTPGPATTVAVPQQMQDRWYTLDRRHSQSWKVDQIDPAAKTAVVTFHSTRVGCTIRDAQGTITDEEKFVVTVKNPNYCFNTFRIEFPKVGNAVTKVGGTLHLVPPVGAEAVLTTQ